MLTQYFVITKGICIEFDSVAIIIILNLYMDFNLQYLHHCCRTVLKYNKKIVFGNLVFLQYSSCYGSIQGEIGTFLVPMIFQCILFNALDTIMS